MTTLLRGFRREPWRLPLVASWLLMVVGGPMHPDSESEDSLRQELATMTADDRWMFNEGAHTRLYEVLGCQLQPGQASAKCSACWPVPDAISLPKDPARAKAAPKLPMSPSKAIAAARLRPCSRARPISSVGSSSGPASTSPSTAAGGSPAPSRIHKLRPTPPRSAVIPDWRTSWPGGR